MEKKLETYAKILLKCVNVKKEQPLIIEAPIEVYEFVRILSQEAYKIGVKDIYFDFTDSVLKHDMIKNVNENNLKNHSFWNKKVWDEYAKKNAAFLMLEAVTPELMNDVDSDLLSKLSINSINTKKLYRKKQMKNQISWCIAGVATKPWAEKLFPNDKNALEKLWDTIFDVCCVNEEYPTRSLMSKINKNAKIANKLTNLNLKELHFKNKLGTDIIIGLPKNYLFETTKSILTDKTETISNIPSEEVFTCPHKDKVNGIVYASKPLVHNGKIIDEFYLEFKNGKVVNYDAKKGKDVLEKILKSDKNSNMLGEVALVEYDSAISKKNILFYSTLFDENAACHLALGEAYPSSIKSGINKSKGELNKLGLNSSVIHVDFMIGTKDMNVVGITEKNEKIEIFKNGKFYL